jgi:hypothetical protein
MSDDGNYGRPPRLAAGPGYVLTEPRDQFPPGSQIVLAEGTDSLAALAAIAGLFDRYAEWELELMGLATGGDSIEAMPQVGEAVLGNPVFAYDAMLRPMADGERLSQYLDELVPEAYYRADSGEWLANEQFLRLLEKIGLLEALRSNPAAFVFDGVQTPFVTANLMINGHTAGFWTAPPRHHAGGHALRLPHPRPQPRRLRRAPAHPQVDPQAPPVPRQGIGRG